MARDSHADYVERGYSSAWEVLARGCEVPPSLEVFDHELKERRDARPHLSVDSHAKNLADAYHRVKGFFDGNE